MINICYRHTVIFAKFVGNNAISPSVGIAGHDFALSSPHRLPPVKVVDDVGDLLDSEHHVVLEQVTGHRAVFAEFSSVVELRQRIAHKSAALNEVRSCTAPSQTAMGKTKMWTFRRPTLFFSIVDCYSLTEIRGQCQK